MRESEAVGKGMMDIPVSQAVDIEALAGELKGLYNAIYNTQCFGPRDHARMWQIEQIIQDEQPGLVDRIFNRSVKER